MISFLKIPITMSASRFSRQPSPILYHFIGRNALTSYVLELMAKIVGNIYRVFTLCQAMSSAFHMY